MVNAEKKSTTTATTSARAMPPNTLDTNRSGVAALSASSTRRIGPVNGVRSSSCGRVPAGAAESGACDGAIGAIRDGGGGSDATGMSGGRDSFAPGAGPSAAGAGLVRDAGGRMADPIGAALG
jgi:hypothetical protein